MQCREKRPKTKQNKFLKGNESKSFKTVCVCACVRRRECKHVYLQKVLKIIENGRCFSALVENTTLGP